MKITMSMAISMRWGSIRMVTKATTKATSLCSSNLSQPMALIRSRVNFERQCTNCNHRKRDRTALYPHQAPRNLTAQIVSVANHWGFLTRIARFLFQPSRQNRMATPKRRTSVMRVWPHRWTGEGTRTQIRTNPLLQSDNPFYKRDKQNKQAKPHTLPSILI